METDQLLSGKLSNVVVATGLSVFLVALSIALLNFTFPLWTLSMGYKEIPSERDLISLLIIAPLAEEFVFRLVPFKLLKDTQIFKDKTYYFVAISAIIFGYIHGGMKNVYIQGIAGFFFGWVYIKNGMSYWSSVATHFLYNFVISIVFPLI